MNQAIWQDLPTVPLFQWLARGSLKQNLPQAMRLWIWLHLLYGSPSIRLNLPDPFTYPEWREVFFGAGHPSGEEKPPLHDLSCPCAKVTAAWLLGNSLTLSQADWNAELAVPESRARIEQQAEQWRRALEQHGALPTDWAVFLNQTRLFGMTRRTLYNDLQVLIEIHWLQRQGQHYRRVTQFPVHLSTWVEADAGLLSSHSLEYLTQPDLAAMVDGLSQRLNGKQRFFCHLEFVVPDRDLDRVEEWQALLQQIWLREPVPPVQIQYQLAGQVQSVKLILYPVCLYYYQRGPYLCGYGQVPQMPEQHVNWRNYRLDRIQSMQGLDWSDQAIPALLQTQRRAGRLPEPDWVQLWMEQAWGFDYYQPAERLLRFDQDWDQRYIRDTLRHPTFEPIAYEAAGELIAQTLMGGVAE